MLKNTKTGKETSNFLGKLFAGLPLHPNSITILSVIMAILGYVTWLPNIEYKIESTVLFILAFFFDAIDGAIARAKKLASNEGAFLDGIADRIVEFFLIMTLFKMFVFNFEIVGLLSYILFFGTCMTSFVKAYAEHQGNLKHEDALAMPGFFERTERSLALIIIFITINLEYYQIAKALLYITAALSIITFGERFWFVYTKKKSS